MKKRSTSARGQIAIIAIFASASALADVEFRGLGFVPGGSSSTPRGISANGAIVVGQSWVSDHYEAYRWSAETGMVSLGDLPGGLVDSMASAVSADGSIVVGRGTALVGLGILIGAVAAIALARSLASLLYGVGAADPMALLAATLALLTAGVLAALVPAWRASRVDPARVLYEP